MKASLPNLFYGNRESLGMGDVICEDTFVMMKRRQQSPKKKPWLQTLSWVLSKDVWLASGIAKSIVNVKCSTASFKLVLLICKVTEINRANITIFLWCIKNPLARTPGYHPHLSIYIGGATASFEIIPIQISARGPWALAICLTTAVGMTNGNFLQTCIKNSLLQTKTIEILGF